MRYVSTGHSKRRVGRYLKRALRPSTLVESGSSIADVTTGHRVATVYDDRAAYATSLTDIAHSGFAAYASTGHCILTA
eukprot:1183518-Rhodomonas_salina.2